MTNLDYTTWPGLADVQDRLTSASVTLRATVTPRMQAAMNAVISEIGNRTQRQFVASAAAETRLYDGSGSAEQEVDEMVRLDAVAVIGIQAQPGYPLSGVQLTSEQGKPQTRLTVSRGSVAAYGPAGVYPAVSYYFPAGRQNVSVTGLFGYGATIPADLWEAACGEMAVRLAAEALFTPAGRLNFSKAGDEEERWKLDDATATGWHDLYTAALSNYKRPSGRRLRNLRPRMT